MALELTWMMRVLMLNLSFGTLLVLGAFKLMEWRPEVGALGGIAVGTTGIYAEATRTVTDSHCERDETVSLPLWALLSVFSTVIVVKPKLS